MLDRIRFHHVPLAGVDAMTATTARTFPRHTHDQYGIGVIDAGGHASSSDRRQVTAGPGTLIFVNPGEVHDGRAIDGKVRAWRMLYFDPDLMQRTRADIRERSEKQCTFTAAVFKNDRVRSLFNAAFSHAAAVQPGRVQSNAMQCETAMIRLIAALAINSTERAEKDNAPTATVCRVRERIDADPAAPLTLADLANEAGLSRYQLIRGFARELGQTPHAYILQHRIALARRLIRTGTALAEAAASAGFCDQSHLTRCFARQIGVAPSRYVSRVE